MHVAETLSPTTYYIGLLLLLSVLLVVCQLSSIDRCCWHSLLRVDPNANPPSELLRGQRLRKQAILELFERTQVTMVSSLLTTPRRQVMGRQVAASEQNEKSHQHISIRF